MAILNSMEALVNTKSGAWFLMTIYKKDNAQQLIQALDSIVLRQSLAVDGGVIVVDGPVSEELNSTLLSYVERSVTPIQVLNLPINVGLSNALNKGILSIGGDVKYIIRHDADDVSRPNRVDRQVEFMNSNPDVAIASGQVAIFDGSPDNCVGYRRLPKDVSMRRFAMTRTPINHSCSIIRRSALVEVSYPSTRLPFEDWWLSLRLLRNGWNIGVLDEVLMDFRGGSEMISRRSGRAYAAQERRYFREILAEGVMPFYWVTLNYIMRSFIRILPLGSLKKLYKLKLHS